MVTMKEHQMVMERGNLKVDRRSPGGSHELSGFQHQFDNHGQRGGPVPPPYFLRQGNQEKGLQLEILAQKL